MEMDREHELSPVACAAAQARQWLQAYQANKGRFLRASAYLPFMLIPATSSMNYATQAALLTYKYVQSEIH